MYILTWKCASRHNGVHFFISHLASWLRTRRFSEPTFRPSGATNHWKNAVNRDVPTFSRICIFFLLTLSLLIFFLLIFSLLTLLTSAFQLSILSEVSLLNFLRSFVVAIDFWENDVPFDFRMSGRILRSHSPGNFSFDQKSSNGWRIAAVSSLAGPKCAPKNHGTHGTGRFIYIKNKQNILRLWIWMINDDYLHLGDAWTKRR